MLQISQRRGIFYLGSSDLDWMARNGWMRCADRNSEADAVEAMAGGEHLTGVHDLGPRDHKIAREKHRGV